MEQGRLCSIASALICAALPCASVSAQDLSEREFLTEYPTVLTASRLRQNIADAPQAVTIIDQDQIRASGVREIPELFRMVPGFNVSYVTHVKGLQPIVSYHGLGREFFSRLQVLIDGRSMNNATLGGVDWNDFPLALDDIERVEVIRGPSTPTYGVGAFLGTINFITKHPSQQRGGYASVNAGNDSILDGVARYAASVGNADFRITAEHQSDNGFKGIRDGRGLDFITTRADWQLSRIDSLMAQAGITSRASDVGTGTVVDPARTARFETGYAQLRWERSFDADNGFSAQLYYYRFKLDDQYVTGPIPEFGNQQFPVDDSSTVSRTDFEAQQTFSIGSTLRGVWGGGLREDVAQAPLLLQQTERLRIARLFGHVEWRATDQVLVNLGALVENNNLTGTDVAPQVSVNVHVERDHVIRIGASKALRNPTLFEEKTQSIVILPGGIPIVVSGGLQPETIVSTEVGYVGEWPGWHALLDLKVFYEKLSNLIDPIGAGTGFPPSFPRVVVNGDDVRQRGIEGQFVWRPLPGTSLAISGAHLEADSADRFGNYSTSAPRNTFHVLGTYRFNDNWDGSLTYHRQSDYRPLGATVDVAGFQRVDLRLARRFSFDWGSGEIGAVVENLFDQQYTEFRPGNVAQRRAWLTFRLRM